MPARFIRLLVENIHLSLYRLFNYTVLSDACKQHFVKSNLSATACICPVHHTVYDTVNFCTFSLFVSFTKNILAFSAGQVRKNVVSYKK
jgi:hypothetical protein